MSDKIKRIIGWVLIVGSSIFSFLYTQSLFSLETVMYTLGTLVPAAIIGYLFSRTKKGTATGILIGAVVYVVIVAIVIFNR